ncbi:MAG: ATP synthase F1 subunit delta [Candidatus Omnitrophica bacterium]|nr:ATP synthase F1 subunit delta [Candidatus Omnitrophota bacterium]
MLSHPASRRYAKALFDSAQEKKCLDEVYQDLQNLLSSYRSVDLLRDLFLEPEIVMIRKEEIMDSIFAKKIHPLTHRFLNLLNQKNRLPLWEEICEHFRKLYLEYKEILEVELISATTLSEMEIEKIKEMLGAKFRKDIQLQSQVDQSLLGGFKIKLTDTIYDLSLQGQLERFKNLVMEKSM